MMLNCGREQLNATMSVRPAALHGHLWPSAGGTVTYCTPYISRRVVEDHCGRLISCRLGFGYDAPKGHQGVLERQLDDVEVGS